MWLWESYGLSVKQEELCQEDGVMYVISKKCMNTTTDSRLA